MVIVVFVVVSSVGVHRALAFLWQDSNPIRMDGPHKNKKRFVLTEEHRIGNALAEIKINIKLKENIYNNIKALTTYFPFACSLDLILNI